MARTKRNSTVPRIERKDVTVVPSIEIRGPKLGRVGLAKRRVAADEARRHRADRSGSA